MRWAQRQRMIFIERSIETTGRVNRSDLMREFGISKPQASIDLRTFQGLFPGTLRYDLHEKAYMGIKTRLDAECLLGST